MKCPLAIRSYNVWLDHKHELVPCHDVGIATCDMTDLAIRTYIYI